MPQVKPTVKLIQYTPDAEKLAAVSAKLCYSPSSIDELASGVDGEAAAGFIEKLMSLGHMSPIEHASFTFGIEGVSRSLLAQITRHRIASFSVQSQRYVGKAADFNYIIPPEIEKLGADSVKEFENQMKQISAWYECWQAKLGGNKESSNEDARFVLPNAAETKFIVTMNARELRHFFKERCCFRAQWEIRGVAWQMLKLCLEAAPPLFAGAGPGCLSGKCTEGKMSCGRMNEDKEIRGKLNK